MTRDIACAIITACTAGLIIAVAKMLNPRQGAEHYYLRKYKPMYLVLKFTHVVLFAALAWNVKFIIYAVFKMFG
jgi:hypothetical protein